MVLLNHMNKDSQSKVIDNFFVTKDFLQAIILMDLFSRFIVLQKGPFIGVNPTRDLLSDAEMRTFFTFLPFFRMLGT